MPEKKTALMKVYAANGDTLGKVQGDPGVIFDNTPELLTEVLILINTERQRDGLEPLRPSQTVGARLLVCYC